MSSIKKLIAVLVSTGFVAAVGLILAPVAFADDGQVRMNVGVDASVGTGSTHGENMGESSTTNGDENEMQASSSLMLNTHASTTEEREQEQHRSVVATQVQLLLQAANRDGGIGQEVRKIANEYASTSVKIDDDESAVQHRPEWLRFLIGSDYKNLGALRSDLVTTQNQIDRLMKAASSTTDASVKANLKTQILSLQASASTTAAFVQKNELQFSLFGWFFHLFNR